MPGERLTYEERERIAAGVAQGHSYAEIARRIGRPASTVSREIARNGGARRYRANLAQQATQWRSRRRKPYPTTETPEDAGPGAMARHEFEDRFTHMMVDTGMPVMQAKILSHLFTTDSGSRTAAEMVAGLHVSPASVSKAAAWLVERGLIGREQEGRRLRYRIDEQASYHAWRASIAAMTAWVDLTGQGADLLGDATPAGARLRDTSRFFTHLRRDMDEAAEHWRQTLATRTGTDRPAD